MIALLLWYFLQGTIQNAHAYWDSNSSSTVEWDQLERTCLWWEAKNQKPIFINCYKAEYTHVKISFGASSNTDAAIRPSPNGRYILHSATETIFSPLIARPKYLPVMAR